MAKYCKIKWRSSKEKELLKENGGQMKKQVEVIRELGKIVSLTVLFTLIKTMKLLLSFLGRDIK